MPGGAGTARVGPATLAARPVALAPPPPGDPLTDPHGFPPVPALAAPVPAAPADPLPDRAEAAALAGAFAADYLSWDEDDPARRGRVLAEHLAVPGGDPAHLGWNGTGRQRADFALPGRARPDGEGRLLVDVRVRVTPYRRVGERGEHPAEPEPDMIGVPAAAPAPTGRGWRSVAAVWVRISVPVVHEGGRLAVDAWEEALGDVPVEPEPVAPDDHTLADDDPLAEPATGTRR